MTWAQPAMAMKSTPFCLTSVVPDNAMECFTKDLYKGKLATCNGCCYVRHAAFVHDAMYNESSKP